MNQNINKYMDSISRFCRSQINFKRDLPIRSSEMGVLIYIEKNNNKVTPVMISSFFGISKPAVTTMINSLVKKEYLTKMNCQNDKRSYTLKLTLQGYNLLNSTYDEYFKMIELIKNGMGKQEFEVFIELIQKANRILGEE